MIRKKIIPALTAVILIILTLSLALSFGCSDDDKLPGWDISSGGGSVKASFSDNGKYGYILTVEGEGKIPDYSSKKDAPWYGKSGRVTDVVIGEGITSVGNNAFTDCRVKSVIIPQSVLSIGENSFNAQTMICAYGDVTAAEVPRRQLEKRWVGASDG